MITVTEDARTHLAAALDDTAPADEKERSCFRIVRENDRLSLVLGQEAETDAVVEHDGKPLLALDQEVAPMLDGRTLDVQPNDQGQPVLAIR